MASRPARRLLVIGLDGATFDLIRPWVEEGVLPHLAALLRRGTSCRLRSTIPPVTFPAWSSFLTGVNPGRHGVLDFTRHRPGDYGLQFVNATDRAAPTFLDYLSQAGRRVASLWVPTTYPPWPLNGIMVSGFDSPVARRLDRSFVFPSELFHELRAQAGGLRLGLLQQFRIGAGWHERARATLLAGLEIKRRLARALLTREPWDCFVMVLMESDTAAHHFWAFHDEASPRRPPGTGWRLRGALRDVYRALDGAVGDLVAAVPPETVVAVVSDHGAGGAGATAVHLNAWLKARGLLAFRRASSGRWGAAHVKRLGLTRLPGWVHDACFRRFGGRLANGLEARVRFGAIDWRRTQAYSEELGYAPAVWVNLAGRQERGIVPPQRYEAVRDTVIRELLAWRHPGTGQPMVRRAYRREEVYHGPQVEQAPDVVVELALEGDYSYCTLPTPSAGVPPVRRAALAETLGGKGGGMNGSHRPEGILILAGAGVRRRPGLDPAAIEDVAPTLLALAGVPVPRGMDGRVLTAALVEPPDDEGPTVPPSALLAPHGYSPAEEARVRARLRALGYV